MVEKEPYGCGVSKIWWRGESDSFFEACKKHDMDYEIFKGKVTTSKRIDKVFLKGMLEITKEKSLWEKFYLYPKAYLYYAIVRIYGHFCWR